MQINCILDALLILLFTFVMSACSGGTIAFFFICIETKFKNVPTCCFYIRKELAYTHIIRLKFVDL